ncbi:uncharacterized protein phrf1 isoform X2 [Hemitrygon akajei]|uniref:uncharacterized protein phrf1 isoform X2 n=1 Tax=Hemitrygon akajei TaxID=2704970 RepID=UPI003BF96B15
MKMMAMKRKMKRRRKMMRLMVRLKEWTLRNLALQRSGQVALTRRVRIAQSVSMLSGIRLLELQRAVCITSALIASSNGQSPFMQHVKIPLQTLIVFLAVCYTPKLGVICKFSDPVYHIIQNANSCPVDRITFKHICVRTHFGGAVLKKLPVQNPNQDNEEEQEDVTNCEVCGRSDREDSLLLCDGCDAGYHLDCLTPALHTVPVEEWFCPECALNNPMAADEEIDDEELAFLVADAPQEPTTSRLRPTARRTRAIARTRQSERVRANVNRSRITRAHQIRDVPQYLMNASLLDETIESVVAGLNTAVYHRPLTPRVRCTKKRRKRTGKKRKRTGTQKSRSKTGTKISEKSTRKRRRKARRKKGTKRVVKPSITVHSRIAKSLGLGKPVNGLSFPSVYKPLEPSLKVMRTDIGAASFSVYGDPNDLDPFESGAEPDTSSVGSLLSNKRKVLSRSALRSHQPVARPISVKLSRNGRLPAVGQEAQAEATPVPDVLESILAGQSVLLMDSSNIVINRDGSLKAKVASNQSSLLPSSSSRAGEASSGSLSTSAHNSGNSTSGPKGDWKTVGLTPTKKSSSTAFPSTSDFPSNPRQQTASSNLRPAFSGTFTPMPEISSGPRTGESASLTGTQQTGAPGKSAGDNQKGASGFTPFRWLNSASNLHIKNNMGTLNRIPPKPALKRLDISEFPRIPKIKSQTMQGNGIPPINKLGGGHQNTQASGSTEPAKSGERPLQERIQSSLALGSANTSGVFPGRHRGQGVVSSSSTQSCVKLMSGARLPSLDPYDPFEPTDDEVQHCGKKGSNSPLPTNVKSADDIYDPFEPTGSDPSSSNSTPERRESKCESESPASSPGNVVPVREEPRADTVSLYFHSDAAELSYAEQSEPCKIKAEAETPAENPDAYQSFAIPSLDSHLEASCGSQVPSKAKDEILSAESGTSKWNNVHKSQMQCSFSVSEDGHRSEQQLVNTDSDGVSSCSFSDEGALKGTNQTVPTGMRTDVDITSENEVRDRADKKVHSQPKARSRSRSSSHSRRRSKNLVRENIGGYRSKSRSKERKRVRSHSRERRRSKSRSRSRSSSSERYRRRKVKQERCRERRGRSRSKSRERRSGSSSSDASTDSRKKWRKISGSKDHKGSYKHSRSSSEKGKRRQYRREQSREQYDRRRRRSTSWSRERRRSRSRDKRKLWPKFREKTKSWSRSSSRERRSRSRSSSRDKRRSRTRSSSREKRRSFRYKGKRRSRTRSRSKERRKPRARSRTHSRSRDQSRSRSREKGSQTKWHAPEVERRRKFTQEEVVSNEKDQEQKRPSPSARHESSEKNASVQELIISCSAEGSQGGNNLSVDQNSSHSINEESVAHSDKEQEEPEQMELPEQSKEFIYESENFGKDKVEIPAVVEPLWEGSDTQTRQAEAEIKIPSISFESLHVGYPVPDEVSVSLIDLCKEKKSAPLTVNEEALKPDDKLFPLPVSATSDPTSFAEADTLNFAKPAIPVGGRPVIPIDIKPVIPVDVIPIPVDVKPTIPVDVKPIVSVDGKPTIPVDVKPIISVDVKPSIPVDGKPSIPADVKPFIPADVKPSIPADVKPSIPADVKPSIPADVKPSIPADIKPSIPADVKPTISIDAKPSIPVDVKPMIPVDVKSSIPVDVKPMILVDVKSSIPVDVKPTTPADVKPIILVDVIPTMPADVKPVTCVDDQKVSVGMSTTEHPKTSVPPSTETITVTSFKSEQVENFAADLRFEKNEQKPEAVCPASHSVMKQEEARTDTVGNESWEKRLGLVKTESGNECGLPSTEPVKRKAETEAASQNTGVKTKPLVKRVTWNLETEKDEAPSGRPARTPMSYRTHRYNKESSWKPPETSQPSNQMPIFQPPPPNYMIPPPVFPGLFPPQAFNQLNMPPPFMPPFPPLHPPPYAPVSQPAPPYIMQGNIPLIGSTPVPPLLPQPTYQAGTVPASTPAPEPHVSQVEGNLDADNKTSEDKTQNENYIKKLHVQERAVEEAKLALKPYYQNKEITKEEYKEILRKAVQKICHSKSGEINPVKVANLVKGYVEKYKHIRKYKKGADGEPSKETDAKAEES